MIWESSRRCGDDRDDTGTMRTTWGGDHRDNGDHSHGDHMGTFWGLWERRGDDVETTGTTWGPWGQHRVETTETTAMGTFWGLWGQCGDNVGTMGTTKSLKMP